MKNSHSKYRGNGFNYRKPASKMTKIDGSFDYLPTEETSPIQLLENLVVLYGPSVTLESPEEHIAIKLHKSDIFGTGGHPSTKAAAWAVLKAFDECESDPVNSFLEYGASTGLLAIIACLAGSDRVHYASDEIEAHALADDNAIANGYQLDSIDWAHELFAMSGWLTEFEGMNEPRFDMVATQVGFRPSTANYLRDVCESLKDGGKLIYSGHKAGENRDIVRRILPYMGRVTTHDCHGWPVITGTRQYEKRYEDTIQ